MGSMTFTGDRPFEFALQQMPTATGSAERVLLILPVRVPGYPENTVKVRMPLSISQANQLAAQLNAALASSSSL
jgi:hypothetical protein